MSWNCLLILTHHVHPFQSKLPTAYAVPKSFLHLHDTFAFLTFCLHVTCCTVRQIDKAHWKCIKSTICSILVSFVILLFGSVRWVWHRVLCYKVIASFRCKCGIPIGVHKIWMRRFTVFAKSYVFQRAAIMLQNQNWNISGWGTEWGRHCFSVLHNQCCSKGSSYMVSF